MAPNPTGSAHAGPSTHENTPNVNNNNNTNSAPSTLAELVALLQATPDAAKAKTAVLAFHTKETRDAVLAGMLADDVDPLDVLDPEACTVGCLYVLSARLTVQGVPLPQPAQLEAFCAAFVPEHARLVPDRVTMLAKGIARVTADEPKFGLAALRNLVLRYPPTLSHLTTIHPIFLNACVTARHYSLALPLLTTPIVHIDTTLSELHYTDNLLYHYAGGVALGALKRWREAEEFFEIVVTAPAQAPAALQYEALKKLVLVQLILYGKSSAPPLKYTHATLARLLKTSPYHTLARAYPQSVAVLSLVANKDIEVFRTDRNVGLVQQVIDRAPRWLVRKLTSTYLTLGLADIAREVGIESEDAVRELIVDMVENDEINASISVDGTVTFFDPTPQFSKAAVDAALEDAQTQSRLLLELERALNTSRDFLAKAIKHKDENWGNVGAADEDAPLYGHGGGGWTEEAIFG